MSSARWSAPTSVLVPLPSTTYLRIADPPFGAAPQVRCTDALPAAATTVPGAPGGPTGGTGGVGGGGGGGGGSPPGTLFGYLSTLLALWCLSTTWAVPVSTELT